MSGEKRGFDGKETLHSLGEREKMEERELVKVLYHGWSNSIAFTLTSVVIQQRIRFPRKIHAERFEAVCVLKGGCS